MNYLVLKSVCIGEDNEDKTWCVRITCYKLSLLINHIDNDLFIYCDLPIMIISVYFMWM